MIKKKKKPAVELSEYQAAIRRHIFNIDKKKQKNFLVEACPGSGKSFTLEVCVRAICKYRPDDTILVLQFNRHIKEAMEKRLAGLDNVTVKTVSSAGLAVMYYSKMRIKGRMDFVKYWTLSKVLVEMHKDEILAEFRSTAADDEDAERKESALVLKAASQLTEVVRMAFNTMTDYTDVTALAEMNNKHSVQCSYDCLLPLVQEVAETGLAAAKEGKIAFEDMIAYPVVKKLKFPKYNWVLCDEGQDLNKAQLEIVAQFATGKNGGWHGVVGSFGDRFQSIMAFAGAMSDSMDQFQAKMNARVMPLSICYRCASSILDLARLIVPGVQDRPNCPKGEVIALPTEQIPSVVQPGDFILCRTTAPLVKQCIELIKHRIPSMVKGRDVAAKLISTFDECIKMAEGTLYSVDMFIGSFKEYANEEISRAMLKKSSATKIQMLEDTHSCILAIASYLSEESKLTKRMMPPVNIKDEINKMFADDIPGGKVTLATVHKSKGLESKNVFIIEYQKMPAVRKGEVPTEDQVQQEKNIKFVALTRAMDKLYICGEGINTHEDIVRQTLI